MDDAAKYQAAWRDWTNKRQMAVMQTIQQIQDMRPEDSPLARDAHFLYDIYQKACDSRNDMLRMKAEDDMLHLFKLEWLAGQYLKLSDYLP